MTSPYSFQFYFNCPGEVQEYPKSKLYRTVLSVDILKLSYRIHHLQWDSKLKCRILVARCTRNYESICHDHIFYSVFSWEQYTK